MRGYLAQLFMSDDLMLKSLQKNVPLQLMSCFRMPGTGRVMETHQLILKNLSTNWLRANVE